MPTPPRPGRSARPPALLPTLLLLALPLAATAADPAPAAPDTPDLAWQQRSDWLNVRTAVDPPAKGDGVADDTAALQAALNRLKDGATLYFPPGTYRLTHTLTCPPGRFPGVSLVGHGRSTVLAWDGEAG